MPFFTGLAFDAVAQFRFGITLRCSLELSLGSGRSRDSRSPCCTDGYMGTRPIYLTAAHGIYEHDFSP